jgi:gliding motility-associated-like protein
MSFYDSGHPNNCTSPVQIGLSPTDDTFGTLVYTAPYSPEPGTWNPRIAVFTVPFDCLFVTVRSLDATCWIRVDNFCIDTTCLAEIPVTQLVMPNVFTPGGDDVNDVFLPVEASYVEEASLVILNRWGEKVFETQDLSAGWDGSVSGKPVDDGTYFWIIEYTDALKERKVMHGFVEVRRQL